MGCSWSPTYNRATFVAAFKKLCTRTAPPPFGSPMGILLLVWSDLYCKTMVLFLASEAGRALAFGTFAPPPPLTFSRYVVATFWVVTMLTPLWSHSQLDFFVYVPVDYLTVK